MLHVPSSLQTAVYTCICTTDYVPLYMEWDVKN